MERIKKGIKKRLIYWPEALLLLICMILLMIGISEKKGYHEDELLSYVLANSEYTPWIVPTQPQGRLAKYVQQEIRAKSFGKTLENLWDTATDVVKNRGNSKLLTYKADVYEEPTWISRSEFLDYCTVDKTDDFNYLSVYFNVKFDNHPPLHFMLLHTVSSIFKGKITPAMGCSINLICVLGMMILLMKLGNVCMKLLGCGEQGRLAGIGAAALYGLSAGALSTTLLVRMYACLTFFCVWLLKIHVDKLFGDRLENQVAEETARRSFEKDNKLLIAVTALGFWTQYFFLFYCIILAAVTAVILLRRKSYKELGRYMLSMITAAVIGLAVFPFAVSDVLSSGRGLEAMEKMGSGLGEFALRIEEFLKILVSESGLICIFALVLVNFCWGILRFQKVKQNKELWAVLIIPLVAYFLLAAKLSPFFVDRYVMPAFPVLFLSLTVGACGALTLLLRDRVKKLPLILAGMLAILALTQPFMTGHVDNAYLYSRYEAQESVSEQYASLPCICVHGGVHYYESLIEFTNYEKTLLVTREELQGRKERASIEELSQVVLLVKNKTWMQETEAIMKSYGFSTSQLVYVSQEDEGDAVLIYSK